MPQIKTFKKLQEFYEPVDCEVIPSIDVEIFQSIRESEAKITLIDVRTTKEFNVHHLEEARSVPLNELKQYTPSEDDREVYVICQSGKRSEKSY